MVLEQVFLEYEALNLYITFVSVTRRRRDINISFLEEILKFREEISAEYREIRSKKNILQTITQP